MDLSTDGKRVAVGFNEGTFAVYSTAGAMREVTQMKHCLEAINDIRFSPNQEFLACASGDNYIDVYYTYRDTYRKASRCKGHTSYMTHIDWSVDSKLIQSTCGAYEIL